MTTITLKIINCVAWDEGNCLHPDVPRRRPSPRICEKCVARIPRDATMPASTEVETKDPRLSALWQDLHVFCRDYQGDVTSAKDWFRAYANRLPCGACAVEWEAMMARTPPPLDDPPAMFPWSVDRHDEVNIRLGYEVWGHERAAAAYY